MKRQHWHFILIFLFTLFANSTAQITKTFTGAGGDNYWTNPNNWEPPGVPHSSADLTSGDNVYIPEGSTVDLEGLFTNALSITNNGLLINGHEILAKDIYNNGSIIGQTDKELLINAQGVDNKGSIGVPGQNGSLIINASVVSNSGILESRKQVSIKSNHIINKSDFKSSKEIKISAFEKFVNEGFVQTTSNTDEPMGNNINITCINPDGTGQFYNTGTVQGGNGEPMMGGGNIYFRTDDFRNRAFINGGMPGEGDNIPGGHVSVWSNRIDNAGVIFAPSGEASFLANYFKHNPLYNDSPKNLNKRNQQMFDPSGEFFRIEADAVFIHSKEMYFGNMGAFGSGTTLIGPDAIYLTNTNDADAVIDFSENNSAGTIVSNTLIALQSNNIIEPAGGIGTLCSIVPRINQGGSDFYGMFLYADDITDTSGNSGQAEVFLKNQCSFGRDFAYVISSALGWVDYDSTYTALLDPWDLFTINADYSIPDNLEEITVDTVKIKAVLSEFATNSRVFLITGIPSGVVSVKDNSGIEPGEYFLSQNYPNPFNPATTIKFGLPNDSYVKLEVFNILGEKVSELIDKEMTAGYHSINFDCSNLSSGVYFYKISAGDFVSTKKSLLIK